MRLDGMHHITMITADAERCVEFYADVLGLRMVKQTVNFDAPDAYHLYFGDEQGSPGSILTWFEFHGAAPGRPGAGMIHTIQLGVGGEASLEFWAARLAAAGHPSSRDGAAVRFRDYDGLAFELVVADPADPPLRARHPSVPEEHALTGVAGARALIGLPLDADAALLTETLGFKRLTSGAAIAGGSGSAQDAAAYRLQGPTRGFDWSYEPSATRGIEGAGTVHHIAWHSSDADHALWRERVAAAGMRVTPVIDRDYFKSIYFRQPQGILFEIATTSPGFAVDEDPAHLGEELRLPAQHEHLRDKLKTLWQPGSPRPPADPRPARRAAARLR